MATKSTLAQRISMKMKVCLVGEPSVGKTSLVRRFVFNTFDPKYFSTIGTNIWKKKLNLVHPLNNSTLDVDMIVWDIMGQKQFRDLLRDAYFFGAKGVIVVCDSTRRETFDKLIHWVEAVTEVTGDIPKYLIANKMDLGKMAFKESEMAEIAGTYDCPYQMTSAKTGELVEEVFSNLAERIVQKRFDNAHARLEEAEKILEKNPEDIDTLYMKGEALTILERYDEAIDVLHEVTRLNPDYPQVWGLKAEVFNRLGEEKMAALCSARA
ncbi:MAG: GTP-binding protein [Thermoplasmata archaeon]